MGLFKKDAIKELIWDECNGQTDAFRQALNQFRAEHPEVSIPEEIDTADELPVCVRKAFLDAVTDGVKAKLGAKALDVQSRFESGADMPEALGLPAKYSKAYFDENGIPAGCLYAICQYAQNGVSFSEISEKVIAKLDDYQQDLMAAAYYWD